jgi:hypothetical protein
VSGRERIAGLKLSTQGEQLKSRLGFSAAGSDLDHLSHRQGWRLVLDQ